MGFIRFLSTSMIFVFVVMIGMSYASSLSVSVTPSQSVIDAGQNTLLTTNITGGTGSYTCSWAYHPFSNSSDVKNFGNQSCTTIFNGNVTDLASPDTILVNVNDSANNTGSGTTYIAVKPALTLNLFASSNIIYAGNVITFTNNTKNGSIVYTGSAPYAFFYENVTSNVIAQSNGNAYLFTTAGSYVITEGVTDSNEDTIYASVKITVLPTIGIQPITAKINPQQATIDAGQSQNIVINATGGTSNYTYEFFVNRILEATSTANTFVFTSNTPDIYKIYAQVKDNKNETANTTNSTITVISSPSISLLPKSITTQINKQVKLTNMTSGGIAPYSYSYSTSPGLTEIGNNFTASIPGIYNVKETVVDSLGEHASASSTVTATAPNIIVSIQPISANIDLKQNVTLNSSVEGGYGAYTYNWIVNTVSSGNGNTLKLTPTYSGNYTVYLLVTDSSNDLGVSNNAIITVAPSPTISIESSSDTVYVENSIKITNVTSGGTAPYVYSYATIPNVVRNGNNFTFSSNGRYTIKETVLDSLGEASSSEVNVTVLNIPVSISVSITPQNSTIHKKQEITLTANIITNAVNDLYSYSWYVKTPKTKSYSLISNATSKNYTFDTLPQSTLGSYYFIVKLNDITANIIVNSSYAIVKVITPASCSNPHYNNSNCDNDNQKTCNGNYEDEYNHNNNMNGNDRFSTWNWNGNNNENYKNCAGQCNGDLNESFDSFSIYCNGGTSQNSGHNGSEDNRSHYQNNNHGSYVGYNINN